MFQIVIATMITSASAAPMCAARLAGARRGRSGRASQQSPANTTEPATSTTGRRYHPTTASSRPTAPKAATDAAIANAKTRIQRGSSYSSNDETLLARNALQRDHGDLPRRLAFVVGEAGHL